MSGHTPGPWATEIAEYGSRRIGTVFGHGKNIAQICGPGAGPRSGPTAGFGALTKETDANARLIAAAPDMLEALRNALEFAEDQEDVIDGPDGQQVPNKAMTLAQMLREVIGKAEGNLYTQSELDAAKSEAGRLHASLRAA